MTFSDDEQGPTLVGDRPGDALATRRHFLKHSGASHCHGSWHRGGCRSASGHRRRS